MRKAGGQSAYSKKKKIHRVQLFSFLEVLLRVVRRLYSVVAIPLHCKNRKLVVGRKDTFTSEAHKIQSKTFWIHTTTVEGREEGRRNGGTEKEDGGRTKGGSGRVCFCGCHLLTVIATTKAS